ncbi:MAG TPA: hypothetical protein VER55_05170 [Ardenticatenaceae bacterium]|nr:hypothetical protein [Ardenticatenaceae bacterium]
MRGPRWSERLGIGIVVLLVSGHLLLLAGLLEFGRGSGRLDVDRYSGETQFAAVALCAPVAVVFLALRRWRGVHDPDLSLLLAALPALTSIALGSSAWTAFLSASTSMDGRAVGWTRFLPLALAGLGIVLGVRYRRPPFLALWLAALGALIATNPLLWQLLPRTDWWDARMLVLPAGVFVILHFSRGWPFALPRGIEWRILMGLLGALWALPPLVQMYRAGEAPAPAAGWLVVMGLLNWVPATLLLALPLYGWRFGWEWGDIPPEPAVYPWPAIFVLMVGSALLTTVLLPTLRPVALALAVGSSSMGATAWVEWFGLGRVVTMAAGWLTLAYLALAGLEALSIWTYQRRRAREEEEDRPSATPMPQ